VIRCENMFLLGTDPVFCVLVKRWSEPSSLNLFEVSSRKKCDIKCIKVGATQFKFRTVYCKEKKVSILFSQ
jgi:hypothetical protein